MVKRTESTEPIKALLESSNVTSSGCLIEVSLKVTMIAQDILKKFEDWQEQRLINGYKVDISNDPDLPESDGIVLLSFASGSLTSPTCHYELQRASLFFSFFLFFFFKRKR